MKKIIQMHKVINTGLRITATAALLFALLACEQPFKAGLGSVVDTRPPTVSLENPGAGDYIWGNRGFVGVAEDDYHLSRVMIRVTNHPDIEYLKEYEDAKLIKHRENKADWAFEFDTTQFPDGDIKIQIMAIDSVNKIAETDEIAMYIKNSPPAISVAIPLIERGLENGNVGGQHLNYAVVDTLPGAVGYRRQIDIGGILAGIISDDDDIYTGREEGGRFPPQIRLWRVNDMADPSDTEGWRPGVLPSLAELPWSGFVMDESLYMLGVGNYQFAWELPGESSRYFGFEIRAQSKDGRTEFHYPRDFWSGVDWDNLAGDGDFKRENRYVLLFIRSPRETPTVVNYELEDIFGNWNEAESNYHTIQIADGVDLTDNAAHPYVNRLTVNKNGPFTLRVKASHSEGISTAEVYWEKSDKSARGRFIWDLADAPPVSVPGWQNANNVARGLAYNYWGFRDPHSFEDGYYRTRNFIFTYNHDGNDRVPADAQGQVRNRSKIHEYTGNVNEWKAGKEGGLWPIAPVFDAAMWKELDMLDEGEYNIEVYARSAYGTAMTTPFTCSVRLDWTLPEVEINGIDGAYSQDLLNHEAVVNGVIRSRFLFSDSHPQDSGLRLADEAYYPGYEQRYILVADGDNNDKLKALIENDQSIGGWWPPTPSASAPDSTIIAGIQILKHGPIVDSACTFKASKVYGPYSGADPDIHITGHGQDEPDTLAAGTYWLYVFVRDNAFNVGRSVPLKLIVDPLTDIPEFDLSIGAMSESVTEPDWTFDYTDKGFWGEKDGAGNSSIRNKFGPNSSIRLRIRDDDSLDLGVEGGAASKVRISFIGSQTDSNGMIIPYDDTDPQYRMDFDDAQVKKIFAAQPLDAHGNRRTVKERQGEISQAVLLELLKTKSNYDYLFSGSSADYKSLPDGVYRVSIAIADYSPAKLVTKTDPQPAAVAERSVHFWIAVDSVNPEISNVVPESGKFIPADKVVITGKLSDRNGPVRKRGFTITDDRLETIDGITASLDDITITQDTSVTDSWAGDFTATAYFDGKSHDYIITLQFEDRFGNYSTVKQSYIVDVDPPVAGLSRGIETFKRDEPDVVMGDGSPVPDGTDGVNNKTRLVNGVVRFVISATDDHAVEGVRWWLAPAGQVVNINPQSVNSKESFFNYSVAINGTYKNGELTDNFNSSSNFKYVDTADLDDGEYSLHVIAIDSAGYLSVASHVKQTVFVLQEEDKPYFGAMTPRQGMVVGGTASDLTLRGTIYEDDGFFSDSAGTVMAGSVKIWMSDNPNASQDPYDTSLYTGPIPVSSGLTRTDKNISLNINLKNLFGGALTNDGLKHYIIEAADSWFGKIKDESGAGAGDADDLRKLRRKYFSFTLDTKDPEIVLTYPAPGFTAGPTAGADFGLVGSIMDANLQTTEGGDYLIGFNVNGGSDKPIILGKPDGAGGYTGYVTVIEDVVDPATSQKTGETKVSFSIPAADFTGAGLLNFANVDPGNNTLMLIVQDKSAKEGSYSLSFTKDTEPPEFAFVNFDAHKLPEVAYNGNKGWWWGEANLTGSGELHDWYMAKHDWLVDPDNALSVIQYETGKIPFITGTFSDQVSNVETASFEYWFDDDIGPFLFATNGAKCEGAPGRNIRWTIYLTSDGTNGGTPLADGVHSVKFTIKDSVGNVLPAGPLYGFRINSSLPTASVTTTGSHVYGDSKSTVSGDQVFTVTGMASSPNLAGARLIIRHTEFKDNPLYEPYEQPLTNDWKFIKSGETLMETLDWTVVVTRSNLYLAGADGVSAIGNNELKEGNYELAVISVDLSGNESGETVWNFIVDSTKPRFVFNDLTAANEVDDGVNQNNLGPAYWLDKTARRNTLISTPRLQGRIYDDYSNLAAVERQIKKYNYADGSWAYYNFAANNWTGTDPRADASWQDMLGAVQRTEIRLDWTLNDPLAGLQGMEDGYYCIQLRAKDSSTIEGGSAYDGNPAESEYVYFFWSTQPPALSHVNDDIQKFSSQIINTHKLPFEVDAADANWFDKLEVKVESVNTGTAEFTVQSSDGPRSGTGSWTPKVEIPFVPGDAPDKCPDGAYRITFTVTNLAGRTSSISRTITLDNRPPTALISEPRFIGAFTESGPDTDAAKNKRHDYASDTIIGGENFIIKGTTDDSGDKGSASGVAGIWYRLGYYDKDELPKKVYDTGGIIDIAETRKAIEAWARLGLDPDKGAADNEHFDTAAKSSGTSSVPWFKYIPKIVEGAPSGYPVPDGFAEIGAIDLYNWALDAQASLASFTLPNKEVKGREYNNGSRFMARQIVETYLPQNLQRGGLYSLPLVLRVVDAVGNIHYDLCDLWIYPNGDNPSSVIINPSDKFTGYTSGANGAPRGGMISIEGVASDNVSVRTVIYRVKAGGAYQDSPGTAPGNSYIVDLDGTKWAAGLSGYAAMKTIWDSKTIAESPDGWYVATLESTTPDPSMPWNFKLNANNKIDNLIKTEGFFYDGTAAVSGDATTRNMIRVWVEVFVFDGTTASTPFSYNRMSLGDDNTDSNSPKPYIREFYLKDTAPQITDPMLSEQGKPNVLVPYIYNDRMRSGQFAIGATLDGRGAPIGSISVKLSGETDNNWKTAWDIKDGNRNLPGITLQDGLNEFDGGQECDLIYSFDSTITADESDWRSIRNGKWAYDGGKFVVDIRVRDASDPPGEYVHTFEIGIDNYAPVADTVKNITPPKVAGTNVSFLGRVFDYRGASDAPGPDYRKIDRIYAWFTTKGGEYINIDTGDRSTTIATTPQRAQNGMDRLDNVLGPMATVSYAYNASHVESVNIVRHSAGKIVTKEIPADVGYVKKISEETAGILANNMTWQPNNDWDIYWSFEANTLNMPDGWITMHYVVIDHAENASYYTQKMVVMNNYPTITNVTLYTNNKGEGAVFTTHEGDEASTKYPIPAIPFNTGYLDSKFISKNKVIGFGVETISGNAPLHYRVQYVERLKVPLTNDNLKAILQKTGSLSYEDDGGSPATVNIINVVNLYTIVNEKAGDIDANIWAALGVNSTNPVAGTHFVFNVDNEDIKADILGSKTHYPTDYVYAYRVQQTHEIVTPQNPDTVKPEDMNFDGSVYFGTDEDLINEATSNDPTKHTNATADNPDGKAFFLIKVWDSVDDEQTVGDPGYNEDDMLYDAVVVGMRVYLSDKVKPTARLYDLNPYTEAAVVGNNIGTTNQNTTIRNAANPTSIGYNALRGGLFNTNTVQAMVKSGYIEPRHNTTALVPWIDDAYAGWTQTQANGFKGTGDNTLGDSYAKDRVSGRVILRGMAWDDQLIEKLNISITGQATQPGTILELKDDGSGVNRMLAVGSAQAWAVETLHWETGHTVEWAYVWNTEFYNAAGTPVQDVVIQVTAIDKNGSQSSVPVTISVEDSSVVTPGKEPQLFHNQVTVDIVPYIYGFERELPKFTTTRSRQGWYSFYQDEPNIAVLGYNLGKDDTQVKVNLDSTGGGGSDITTVWTAKGTLVSATVPSNIVGRFSFSIPAGASSGKLNVTVGGTAVHNHDSSHTNKSWNREYNAYTTGSDLWVNKPHAHIWTTAHRITSPVTFFGSDGDDNSSKDLNTPGMTMEYASANSTGPGRLHGSWATYALANFFYGVNTTATTAGAAGAPSNRVPLNNGNPPGEPYTTPDISIHNGQFSGVGAVNYPPVVVGVYQQDGTSYILLKTRMDSTNAGTTMSDTNTSPTERWQNNRIVKASQTNSTTEGNNGISYITSYDSYNKYLWFGMRNAGNSTLLLIDGSTTLQTANRPTAIVPTTGITTNSTNAGEYSAVDYDQYGPIVAYYDEITKTLRIAYASSLTAPAANNWRREEVIPSGHPLYSGSGKYVSIKVDRRNNVHLAFYNSNYQTVVYAFAAARTSAAGEIKFDAANIYTVDNVIKGGNWTDISVDNYGNPMITYSDTSRTGNYDGVRIAYRSSNDALSVSTTGITFTTTLKCPVTKNDITGWEALTMPADYTINNDRLNVEVWPPSNRLNGGTAETPAGTLGIRVSGETWNVAVGYASDRYRIGYFYYPQYKGY